MFILLYLTPLNVQIGRIWQPLKAKLHFTPIHLRVVIGFVEKQVLNILHEEMVLVDGGYLGLHGSLALFRSPALPRDHSFHRWRYTKLSSIVKYILLKFITNSQWHKSCQCQHYSPLSCSRPVWHISQMLHMMLHNSSTWQGALIHDNTSAKLSLGNIWAWVMTWCLFV